MDGQSLDIKQDHIKKLKTLFPEAITEAKVDWEKLKATLGEDINFSNERYVLNWAGKSEAFKVLQEPTTATLVPDKAESVNFDDTGHLFIEGENLEVLKVLQKSYYGKVKMIYIDPPYNTGNDHFIYPDRFSESKEEYLKRVGEKDEDGYLTREGLFRANSKDSGHYHSNWMNMMYPRLFLGKNLLKDDGFFVISIDDAEYYNLKHLVNEIFGEENSIATLVWDRNRKNDARFFSVGHEYMLVYAKNKQAFLDKDVWFREPKEGLKEVERLYQKLLKRHGQNWDEIQKEWREYFRSIPASSPIKKLGRYSKVGSKGPYRDDGNISWPGGGGPKYEVLHPETKKPCKVPDGGWRYSKPERFWEEVDAGKVVFGPDETTLPRQCRFIFDGEGQVMPSVIYSYAQTVAMEFLRLMGERVFENPKNWKDIARIINYLTDESDIVLDFFAGSNTTGHAVLELNKNYGNRKFICVQLPEECDQKTEAHKAGYRTIADIAKERIRRVIKKIEKERKENKNLFSENEQKELDLGFKVFKLQPSNFKIWRGDKLENGEQLAKQLQAFTDPTKEGSAEENMFYELLLKSGFSLNSTIEDKKNFFVVNENQLVVALTKMSETIVKEIIAIKPEKCIALDKLFADNDQLKTNTVLQMKDAGIEFKTI